MQDSPQDSRQNQIVMLDKTNCTELELFLSPEKEHKYIPNVTMEQALISGAAYLEYECPMTKMNFEFKVIRPKFRSFKNRTWFGALTIVRKLAKRRNK